MRKRNSQHRLSSEPDDDVSMASGLSDSESSSSDQLQSTQFTTMFGKKARRVNSSNDRLPTSSTTAKLGVEDRLVMLEKEIASLRAINDARAILFCSLGFKNRRDVENWLLQYSPNTSFGLVLDVHMICEHIHAQLFGRESTLVNLQNLAKLKLKSDTGGLAATSFERRIPKIFLKSVAFKAVRQDTSYFYTITSYCEWCAPDDGFRDSFLKLLKEFQQDHQQLLAAELDQTSTFYHVAHTSLTVSVAWLEEFVRYMDDTYTDYVDSKFNSKKAWNITTRLSKTLLDAISEPRNGLSKSFRTRKPWQIKNAIFYSTLQSLDIMQKISQAGFKNAPILSQELVKFLAKNTNVEAIDRLSGEISSLRSENTKLRADLKESSAKSTQALSLANTVNNKSDQLKSSIADHAKRLKTVEAKVA